MLENTLAGTVDRRLAVMATIMYNIEWSRFRVRRKSQGQNQQTTDVRSKLQGEEET